MQRFLCKECYYRFTSTKSSVYANKDSRLDEMDAKHVSLSLVQKLAQIDTRQEAAQRESTTTNNEVKGRIIEYAFWMKKEGYAEATIARRGKLLQLLAKRGALLLDSESVKAVIAAQVTWNGKTKELAVEAYAN